MSLVHLCRICLTEKTVGNERSVINISKKFQTVELSNIVLMDNPFYPVFICKSCHKDITFALKIKNKIIKSEEFIRSQVFEKEKKIAEKKAFEDALRNLNNSMKKSRSESQMSVPLQPATSDVKVEPPEENIEEMETNEIYEQYEYLDNSFNQSQPSDLSQNSNGDNSLPIIKTEPGSLSTTYFPHQSVPDNFVSVPGNPYESFFVTELTESPEIAKSQMENEEGNFETLKIKIKRPRKTKKSKPKESDALQTEKSFENCDGDLSPQIPEIVMCDTTAATAKRSSKSKKMKNLHDKYYKNLLDKTQKRKGKLQCDHCDYTTDGKKDLKMHIFIHLGIKNYSCKFCNLEFVSENNLVRHENGIHRKLKCSICKKVMGKFETLDNHNCNVGKFLCKYCQKIFYYSSTLRRHIRGFHLDLKCLECSKIFSSQKLKDNHICKKYRDCETCGKSYKVKSFYDHKCKPLSTDKAADEVQQHSEHPPEAMECNIEGEKEAGN